MAKAHSGPAHHKFKDLAGRRFGMLVVAELAGFSETPGRKRSLWRCVCDCGGEKVVPGVGLSGGGTKSCGCLKPRVVAAAERPCRACGVALPWTLGHFYASPGRRTSSNPDGLVTTCIPCWKVRAKAAPSYRAGKGRRDPEAHRRLVARTARLNKLEVLRAYAGESPACDCCGEARFEFLSIDHVGGGGAEHRRSLGGRSLYADLKSRGYPDGFRVLCMNCNFAIGKFGYCPHRGPAIDVAGLAALLSRREEIRSRTRRRNFAGLNAPER